MKRYYNCGATAAFGWAALACLASSPVAAQRVSASYIVIENVEEEQDPDQTQAAEPTEEEKELERLRRKREAEARRKEWEIRRERLRQAALDDIYPFQDKKLKALTTDRLETFRNDGDLLRWLEQLEDVREDTDEDWMTHSDLPSPNGLTPNGEQPVVIAAFAMQDAEEDACANPEDCEEAQAIIVSATKAKPSAPNVTNVQSVGVDEGDIVKQIGDYLLTLQDGRIFAVDMRVMKLTDRIDVYRRDEDGDLIGADWYDEMLVQDDHILITAYSYEEEATELSIFKLDQDTGKVSRGGVFLISSDDYYDSNDYASRIIDDKLVLYAPYGVNPYDYDYEDDGLIKPYVRRWLPEDERDEEQAKGKPLFGARDIYKPLLATNDPTIHTISVCPLGRVKAGKSMECRTTGFLGPYGAQMYVNANNIYLWNSLSSEVYGNYWMEDCAADQLRQYPGHKDVAAGALYKISVRSGDVGVVGVRGGLYDQYSMDEYRGRLRALSPQESVKCAHTDYGNEGRVEHVALLDFPLRAFGTVFEEVPRRAYSEVPPPMQGYLVQNRFSGNWLTYGGKGSYWRLPDEDDEIAQAAGNYAVAVPVGSPEDAQQIPLGHSVARLELVGEDVVVTGYRDQSGLSVSFLKMDGNPRLSDQLFLQSRYETEKRSHAFNSVSDMDGASLMGLPTSVREQDSGRYVWWSDRSDLSFISVSPDGKLSDAGALLGTTEDESEVHEDYLCEISCVDWYGNARPIFTADRIFGLMDTSLVEAELIDGQIAEKARTDMTVPVEARPIE